MSDISKNAELQQSCITTVSGSCDKIPYTKNTKEAREFLERNRYNPLRFFQGKEYVRPSVGTFANAHAQWLVYDYTTFDKNEKKDYMQELECDFEKFKSEIMRLYPQ